MAAFLGTLAGALLMAVVQVIMDKLFAPQAFRDGQYAFGFISSMPLGALAGAVAAGAGAAFRHGNTPLASWTCLGGGVCLLALLRQEFPRWDFHYVPWVAFLYGLALCQMLVGLVLCGVNRHR